MIINGPLIEANFLRRVTRFSALVRIGQKEELVYVPNSGRMRELLVRGNRVLLQRQDAPHRKTKYDMIMVRLGRKLVSMDSRVPAKLIREAIDQDQLPEFKDYEHIIPEARYGHSRLDLLLTRDQVDRGQERCYIEVKSVTLVQGTTGRFPDAPTARGTRHLKELIRIKKSGARAAVIFVIQRVDAHQFEPNDERDPEFGLTLRQAVKKGVESYAYSCHVSPESILLKMKVPVLL